MQPVWHATLNGVRTEGEHTWPVRPWVNTLSFCFASATYSTSAATRSNKGASYSPTSCCKRHPCPSCISPTETLVSRAKHYMMFSASAAYLNQTSRQPCHLMDGAINLGSILRSSKSNMSTSGEFPVLETPPAKSPTVRLVCEKQKRNEQAEKNVSRSDSRTAAVEENN